MLIAYSLYLVIHASNSFGLLPQGYCERRTPKYWKDDILIPFKTPGFRHWVSLFQVLYSGLPNMYALQSSFQSHPLWAILHCISASF